MWKPGTKFISEANRDLGAGVVIAVDGRFIDVFFPDADKQMRLTPEAARISPIRFVRGDEVRVDDGEPTRIVAMRGRMVKLEDGSMADIDSLWPVVRRETPVDRLMSGLVDEPEEVLNRVDGQRLLRYRRRGDVASIVGGRVELFEHQIDTAARAISHESVRWLLADGVGLGKTVVACMIASALIRMGRVEQVVIITPDTLTVQWLGELYRKFHQVFVHIDKERLAHVRSDFGRETNPFDVHRMAVVSAELLAADPMLLAALGAADPQLIVVDEAHRTIDERIGDVVLPTVEQAEHALLLTATPFLVGREGFGRLAAALGLELETREEATVVPGVSAVTRDDLLSFPVRVPRPVDIDDGPRDLEVEDPRVRWLLEKAGEWKDADEKVLVFVDTVDRAKKLAATLSRELSQRVFLFHEEMGTKARDIELAQFRLSPVTFLVSSGGGSEGRNFQFCEHVVHVDLPDDPVVLEQRIGRLDRIGRDHDVPIHYFRREGAGGRTARIYELAGLFEDATVGSSPAMARLREVVRDPERDEAEATRIRGDATSDRGEWIFPDSFQRDPEASVLDAIPADLDETLERFCVEAAEAIAMDVAVKESVGTHYFEYGGSVEVETIPGLPVGSRFLGTFDRRLAIENEALDFFANGHPLVEGLLDELGDSKRGRVGALKLSRERTDGLLGLYLLMLEKRNGGERPRLVPLMHGGEADPDSLEDEAAAQALYDELDMGIALTPQRTLELTRKLEKHPAIGSLDTSRVAQAVLVAVAE